jgi:hypothetical protein
MHLHLGFGTSRFLLIDTESSLMVDFQQLPASHQEKITSIDKQNNQSFRLGFQTIISIFYDR